MSGLLLVSIFIFYFIILQLFLSQAEEELRSELENAGSEGLQLDTKKAAEYARLREEVQLLNIEYD